MKKYKNLLLLSSLILLLGILVSLLVFFWDRGERPDRLTDILLLFIPMIGALGCAFLILRKSKVISKLLIAGNIISLCILLVFGCFYLLATNHSYTGNFSITTSLFDNKNILIVIPHQDDDINLMGGLIEQFAQGNSEITVVFTTNGDGDLGNAEIRAAEAVAVLTALGVKKENIYYLGFGDTWESQVFDDQTIRHIYNSSDPDAVWTSSFGATATYGTQSIPCYLELPYTRGNYVYALEAIIREIMPETIFAVDFDTHIEHRATDLFFEEALCNVLKTNSDYHPTVYKGFCYGTAWKAEDDYYNDLNLLSSKKPDDWTWSITSFGYTWEDRLRFPVSSTNLNAMLLNNSVYHSFNDYGSQFAYIRAQAVLNGDKVFWERRTDSLLYDAEISVGGNAVTLLNDFKLKDFTDLYVIPDTHSGTAVLNGSAVQVKTQTPVAASCVYLYDNPHEDENILEGYITFSDGSKIQFGQLNKNGSATVISFPEKQIEWFEIVPTKTEGDYAGLCEIELYHEPSDPREEDTYLIAVDGNDNFVYDYLIHEGDTASFTLYRFPYAEQLSRDDITVSFESDGNNNAYHWDGDTITVTCAKGSKCIITVSAEDSATTFTVSNPPALTRIYLSALRSIEKVTVQIRYLVFCLHQVFNRIFN